jgi:hypothetical protein
MHNLTCWKYGYFRNGDASSDCGANVYAVGHSKFYRYSCSDGYADSGNDNAYAWRRNRKARVALLRYECDRSRGYSYRYSCGYSYCDSIAESVCNAQPHTCAYRQDIRPRLSDGGNKYTGSNSST